MTLISVVSIVSIVSLGSLDVIVFVPMYLKSQYFFAWILSIFLFCNTGFLEKSSHICRKNLHFWYLGTFLCLCGATPQQHHFLPRIFLPQTFCRMFANLQISQVAHSNISFYFVFADFAAYFQFSQMQCNKSFTPEYKIFCMNHHRKWLNDSINDCRITKIHFVCVIQIVLKIKNCLLQRVPQTILTLPYLIQIDDFPIFMCKFFVNILSSPSLPGKW